MAINSTFDTAGENLQSEGGNTQADTKRCYWIHDSIIVPAARPRIGDRDGPRLRVRYH
jgi:hypothetical protein